MSTRYTRTDDTSSNWIVSRKNARITHKHQETILLCYSEVPTRKTPLSTRLSKRKVVMDKLEFSYPTAKKFLVEQDFPNLPWVIESEDNYFKCVDNYNEYKKTFGWALTDPEYGMLSAQDKKDILSILEKFIYEIDNQYVCSRNKRR